MYGRHSNEKRLWWIQSTIHIDLPGLGLFYFAYVFGPLAVHDNKPLCFRRMIISFARLATGIG